MTKSTLLLLDANVVIKLHELGLWTHVVQRHNVFMTATVLDEARYYRDGELDVPIELATQIQQRQLTVVEMDSAVFARFKDRFSPGYFERLDPGEGEALAFLDSSAEPFLLCSSDAIVFRTLALLNRSEQGLSLEETLSGAGLSRKDLPWQFTRRFREVEMKRGRADAVTGFGLKKE
jgi:hypothetical protein